MAIGISSIVAVKVSSTALAFGNVSAQPPCFGVSETASTPFTVTWQSNGSRVASIPLTSLDEILNPSADTLALVGSVVAIGGYSSAYNGVVIGAYSRNGTQECVLVRTLQGGAYLECDATTVSAVSGQ